MSMENIYLAIPLAPLLGAIIAGLFGRQIGRVGAHTVTILGVAIAFVLSVAAGAEAVCASTAPTRTTPVSTPG